MRTQPHRLIESGVGNLQKIHEILPLAGEMVIITHPGDGPISIRMEIDGGEELGHEISVKGLVESNDVTNPKLIHQGKSIGKVVRMLLHVCQTDGLHIGHKLVLPVRCKHVEDITLLLIPELGLHQGWITRLPIRIDPAIVPVLWQRELEHWLHLRLLSVSDLLR